MNWEKKSDWTKIITSQENIMNTSCYNNQVNNWIAVQWLWQTESRLDAKQFFLAMSSNVTACFKHKICIISLHKSHNHHSSLLNIIISILHHENTMW